MRVAILTGREKGKERRELLARLEACEIDLRVSATMHHVDFAREEDGAGCQSGFWRLPPGGLNR